ncbi:hypothetical protein [Actinoplanes xinjiangensis]|uniref:hypothetical protein n=1 Tax=Actinoplanes xinjiangensis TaxID=512350 RepID=UPI0034160AA6
MKIRRIASAALVIGAAAALNVGLASPSQAAGCVPDIGFTIKDGSYIKGSASLPSSCSSGQTARVVLDHKVWGWGWPLVGVDLRGPGARSVVYNCAGTGTYSYRTYVTWTGLDGATRTKYSNEIRVAC